jgi:anaerobic selenocysteine-containing dehydrogenase
MARAIPLYAGIERFAVKGDVVQWGGPHLFADGRFATPDARARFSTVRPRGRRRLDRDAFHVSTRRGKQFNSMVQRPTDPLTGAGRDDILIAAEDAARLGLAAGCRVRLVSTAGAFEGRLFIAPMRQGNLEVHWPEGNALLSASLRDPESGEPDYNIKVRIERLDD